jgi:glycosyltransferase involved in cell wall biosynthesis
VFTSVPGTDRGAMAALLRQASLVVSLSEYESQGLAVAEALALGRPVLATDATALAEYVRAGAAVGLPPGASPNEVAAGVVAALDNPAPGHSMALPTWDETTEQLLTLYRSVCRRPLVSSVAASAPPG